MNGWIVRIANLARLDDFLALPLWDTALMECQPRPKKDQTPHTQWKEAQHLSHLCQHTLTNDGPTSNHPPKLSACSTSPITMSSSVTFFFLSFLFLRAASSRTFAGGWEHFSQVWDQQSSGKEMLTLRWYSSMRRVGALVARGAGEDDAELP